MKETVSRKKEAHKAMFENSTEENNRCKSMKNKAITQEMREKAEEVLAELQNCPNGMFRVV